MSTFALRFNKNCDMDYLPKDPAILVSSVNMLLRDEEFDTLESLCYNFGTEPKEIKNYLYGHGFVYSKKQKQFRPIGYDADVHSGRRNDRIMKWTILSDNRSSDSHLSTEHGLSILLETERHKILLDTGASDLFIRNAEQLGIDLSDVDYVFISHGHSDHAGGLRYFLEHNQKAKVIVSHDAMSGQFFSKRGNLHSITTEWPEIDDDSLLLIDQTCEVADSIHVISRIPQIHPTPKGNQNLYVQDAKRRTSENNVVLASTLSSEEEFDEVNGAFIHDDFRHELVLYVDGLLFTGCAHSGLENILAACPWPVHTVVGGFHLLDGQESEEELVTLAHKLKANYPETLFYTSHCTGDHVYDVMKDVMGKHLHAFSLGTVISR